jgi:hypothetical protein
MSEQIGFVLFLHLFQLDVMSFSHDPALPVPKFAGVGGGGDSLPLILLVAQLLLNLSENRVAHPLRQ